MSMYQLWSYRVTISGNGNTVKNSGTWELVADDFPAINAPVK